MCSKSTTQEYLPHFQINNSYGSFAPRKRKTKQLDTLNSENYVFIQVFDGLIIAATISGAFEIIDNNEMSLATNVF